MPVRFSNTISKKRPFGTTTSSHDTCSYHVFFSDELAEGNSARGDLYIFDGNGVPPIADIPLSHVNYLQCLHLPAKDSQING